jgi:uncharacterized protein YbbK (DUF523 family)
MVLVSACLLGSRCRYDGRHNRDLGLEAALAHEGLQPVAFCPEEHGGLGTPRPAAWIEREGAAAVLDQRARVLSGDGRDVSAAFLRGAQAAWQLCRANAIDRAYLKERSPSCGVRQTHVAGALVEGRGVTAELLARQGVQVHGV